MDPEMSAEDLAEYVRLDAIYKELSEGDRYYVVQRWDEEEGLEPTWKRERCRDETPRRRRQRKLWMAAALIPIWLLWFWWSGVRSDYQQREGDSFVLDYLREHAREIPGLQSGINQAEREYENFLESHRPDEE